MDLNKLAEASYRIYNPLEFRSYFYPDYWVEEFRAGDVVANLVNDTSHKVGPNIEVNVVFRGTAQIATAFRDLDIRLSKCGAGRAHKGFADGLVAVWPEIFDRLISLPSTATIHFAGHSFGAALAGLAAYKFDVLRDQSPELPQIKSVALFGCPRFADIKLRKDFNRRLGKKTFRIVNESDPVTLIPLPGIPWLPLPVFRLSYRHVGTFAWLMESLNGSTIFRRRTNWISWLNVSRRAIGDLKNDILDDHSAETYFRKLEILARQSSPRSVTDTLFPELAL